MVLCKRKRKKRKTPTQQATAVPSSRAKAATANNARANNQRVAVDLKCGVLAGIRGSARTPDFQSQEKNDSKHNPKNP